MNYMLCRNRVRNFDQWKRVFDNHADAHRAAGLKLVHVWYELNSPRNVFFLFEVEEIERARTFLESADATGFEREAGVIEGDFRVFSESLGYGALDEARSRAFAEATEKVAATAKTDNSPAEAMKSAVLPEPIKSPELEKSPPTLSEPVKTAEPTESPEPEKSPALSEPVKTAEVVNSSVPPEPVKSPEPEKSPALSEPVKTAEVVNSSVPPEPVKSPEPEKSPALSESVKAAEPVKSPMPSATMKGPERVKSVPPLEPVEGWEPVENWPPAEAPVESTRQPSRELPPKRGRWVRIKY